MTAWISTGPNPPISATQVADVVGGDVLKQFAAKAGGLLASLLPAVVDQLTPDGAVPETNTLESALGGLLGGLAR